MLFLLIILKYSIKTNEVFDHSRIPEKTIIQLGQLYEYFLFIMYSLKFSLSLESRDYTTEAIVRCKYKKKKRKYNSNVKKERVNLFNSHIGEQN